MRGIMVLLLSMPIVGRRPSSAPGNVLILNCSADDPYLGASSAPYPPPQRVMSPSQPQGYYDPYQDNPDYAPPSPYYPPPSRNAGSATGRSSPFQGGLPPAASPPIGVQPPTMSPHQQMHSPYGEHEDAYHPHLDPPMSPAAAVATAPRASPPIQQHKSMRLSIANPDGQGSE